MMSSNQADGISSGQALYKRARQIIPGGTQLLSKRPEMLLPDYWPAYYSRANLYAKLKREDEAVEDMKMVAQMTSLNVETFANEQNIWSTQHFRTEDAMETELER